MLHCDLALDARKNIWSIDSFGFLRLEFGFTFVAPEFVVLVVLELFGALIILKPLRVKWRRCVDASITTYRDFTLLI